MSLLWSAPDMQAISKTCAFVATRPRFYEFTGFTLMRQTWCPYGAISRAVKTSFCWFLPLLLLQVCFLALQTLGDLSEEEAVWEVPCDTSVGEPKGGRTDDTACWPFMTGACAGRFSRDGDLLFFIRVFFSLRLTGRYTGVYMYSLSDLHDELG